MTELHRTAASLRFFGDDLDPDEITSLLGGSPTHFYRTSDPKRLKDGREWRERRGHWRRVSERQSPGDLDVQIDYLLADLSMDLTVWQALTKRFQGDVFCGLFMHEENEGIIVSPRTLLALGARGLTLDFDIYGPDRDAPSPDSIEFEEQ